MWARDPNGSVVGLEEVLQLSCSVAVTITANRYTASMQVFRRRSPLCASNICVTCLTLSPVSVSLTPTSGSWTVVHQTSPINILRHHDYHNLRYKMYVQKI